MSSFSVEINNPEPKQLQIDQGSSTSNIHIETTISSIYNEENIEPTINTTINDIVLDNTVNEYNIELIDNNVNLLISDFPIVYPGDSINDQIASYLKDGSGIHLQVSGSNLYINVSGLNSSYISDFSNIVSGLLPTIQNSGDNRILTSTGTSTGINAENNLTFNGNILNVNGNTITNSLTLVSGIAPTPTTNTVYNLNGVLYYQNNPIAILPSGGLQNQILQKISDLSYDLQWINNFATEINVYVKNTTGGPLYKGQAVYINGAQGDNPTITLAIASGEVSSSKTLGLLKQDLSVNAFGYVVSEGILEGLDTGSAIAAGDSVWLSPTTPGGVIYGTANKPSAPYHMVFIGYVLRKQQNNGKIYVKVQNGFELQELHNVAINGVTNGQFLQYNSGSGLWTPSSSGNFANLSVNNTTVSVSGHSHLSTDITDFNTSVNNLITAALPDSSVSYRNISSSTQISGTDSIIFAYCSSSNVDLSMPSAVSLGGKRIYIKKNTGNYNLTIIPYSGQTIDGQSSFSLPYVYQSITLISDNNNWFLF